MSPSGGAAAAGLRVAIHQPNYAPWCGFFAKLKAAQVLVLLDDAQLPRGRSYVARTRILGAQGPQWLTIPLAHGAGELQRICQARIADPGWARRHLQTLRARYGRSPFFAEVFALLAPLYEGAGPWLAEFNERLLHALLAYLGLQRRVVRASTLACAGRGDERLVALVQAVGGTTYLSGPSGPKYQAADKFSAAGLQLTIRTYVPLAYPQGQPSFVGGLSVLDALFRCGRATSELLVYPEPGSEPGPEPRSEAGAELGSQPGAKLAPVVAPQ